MSPRDPLYRCRSMNLCIHSSNVCTEILHWMPPFPWPNYVCCPMNRDTLGNRLILIGSSNILDAHFDIEELAAVHSQSRRDTQTMMLSRPTFQRHHRPTTTTMNSMMMMHSRHGALCLMFWWTSFRPRFDQRDYLVWRKQTETIN